MLGTAQYLGRHIRCSAFCGISKLVRGYLYQGEDQAPTIIRLLRCSWRPTVVRYLIESLSDTSSIHEAAVALNISLADISQLQHLDLKERQWRATDISQTLQDSHTRTTHVSAKALLHSQSRHFSNKHCGQQLSLLPTCQELVGSERIQLNWKSWRSKLKRWCKRIPTMARKSRPIIWLQCWECGQEWRDACQVLGLAYCQVLC